MSRNSFFALVAIPITLDWRWVFPLLAVIVAYVLWQIATMDEYFPHRITGRKGGRTRHQRSQLSSSQDVMRKDKDQGR